VNITRNVGPNELCIVPQQHLVNIAQNVGPNELCIVPQQHLVNIAQNVGPNELCIVPQQQLVNIPQNVGMNELCIISHYVGTSSNLSKIKAWLDKFMWQFAFPICISFLHGKRSEILWCHFGINYTFNYIINTYVISHEFNSTPFDPSTFFATIFLDNSWNGWGRWCIHSSFLGQITWFLSQEKS